MKNILRHFGLLIFVFFILQLVLLFFSEQILSADQQLPDNQIYLADLSKKLKLRYPNNPIVNIICIGNSVPAGFTKTPLVDPFSAYPHLLHRELKRKYPYAILNVIVSARGGETSDRGFARFKEDVLPISPDLITIDYGLTDIWITQNHSLKSMIEVARGSGIKVILLTPTTTTKKKLDNLVKNQAEMIRYLAKEYKVGLSDSYAAFQRYVQEGGKLEDLLANKINHPNRKGHELVTNELLKWFTQ